MARTRAASNLRSEPLSTGWELTELAGGSVDSPAELCATARDWSSALCPGTVASALRARNEWDFSSTRNFDGSQWWYRTRFAATPCQAGESLWLEFDGLATLSDVWLNGVHVLRSDNMFCAHELDVSQLIRDDNQLFLRFSSLDAASSVRRPRPRFKTRLIERQQLRWFRTTLLGRMPGWTPPVTAVGPWRDVRLVRRRSFSLRRAELASRVENGRALVRAALEFDPIDTTIVSATLHVGVERVACERTQAGVEYWRAELEVRDAQRWWPHSYGEQPRYPTRVVVLTANDETHELVFDSLAFREIRVESEANGFALVVNGLGVRCRGACWVPSDVVSLHDEVGTLATLRQARAAGMNMLRVGGTMIYESDAFYEECDRSGILVWQDFMFANCDYPSDDPEFLANVTREAEQFLARTETRASLAVLCGSSEVEQQVAMLGLPREAWRSPLFDQLLRGLAERRAVPYVSSTPTGGALPFQADVGITHYYGVGAYLRPLEDARRADVKFATECLAFANIPEERALVSALGDGSAPFHHPRWKARSPRDNGAGWDFDDVRDYYTELLFAVDPNLVRYEDPERALCLGRVTSGEVMARTLAEWRRPASHCRGALIWFLRDLWPGAGWGIIDSLGVPKAAYYYVKRAMQARNLALSDEGLNGLAAHVINDSAVPLVAELSLQLLRSGSVRIAAGATRVELPGRGSTTVNCSTLFDHFIDLTHAYRFGPRQYDVAVVTLCDSESGLLISQASYFPGGLSAQRTEDLGLEGSLSWVQGDEWQLRVISARFALAVAVDVPGFTLDDNYFDVSPTFPRTIVLHAAQPSATPRGSLLPLNAHSPTRISVSPRPLPGA